MASNNGRERYLSVSLTAALFVVLGALVYAPSLEAPFIFDDHGSIVENPNIRQLRPLSRAMSAPSQAPTAGRPIVCLSFALNHALGGLNTTGYHLFNLAVHVLCALLLMGIVRRTLTVEHGEADIKTDPEPRASAGADSRTPAPPRGLKPAAHSANRIAAVVGIAWMVHPLLTDAVTYVTQRTELLMALFYMLTLYCFIRGCASAHRRVWFGTAFVSCALGMGCKEVMVTAPLMILLYDRTFVSGSFRSAWRNRRWVHACMAATWIILAILMADGPRSKSIGLGHGVTALDYLRTQAGIIVLYLRLSFWPSPLVISYDDWPVARTFAGVWPYAIAVVVLLAGTVWALWRKPRAGFLGAWFFLLLAPTSSFVPIVTETAAERRMYLPLAGVVVAILLLSRWLLKALLQRLSVSASARTSIAGVLCVVLLASLGYGTLERNKDYRSRVAIWADVLAKRPRNALAHSGLGLALADIGRSDEAFDHLAEAVQLRPRDAELHWNLARALDRRGEYEQAVEHFLDAIRLRSHYQDAHNSLGNTLVKMGRTRVAREHYEEALRINPTYVNAHANLANLLATQGKIREALTHYAEVVRFDASDTEARYNLGLALRKIGRIDEAIEAFRETLRRKPDYAAAQRALDALTPLPEHSTGP